MLSAYFVRVLSSLCLHTPSVDTHQSLAQVISLYFDAVEAHNCVDTDSKISLDEQY